MTLDTGYVEPTIGAWRRLPKNLREKAVKILRDDLQADSEHATSPAASIRDAISKNPEGWVAPYHFGWGMAVRNRLRESGMTDDQLPPSVSDCNKGDRNWDDYYVAVVEVAVRAGIWSDLFDEERA